MTNEKQLEMWEKLHPYHGISPAMTLLHLEWLTDGWKKKQWIIRGVIK